MYTESTKTVTSLKCPIYRFFDQFGYPLYTKLRLLLRFRVPDRKIGRDEKHGIIILGEFEPSFAKG
jgi:hypothetical protein